MREPSEEAHFNRLTLVRRQGRYRGAQQVGLLALLELVVRILSHLSHLLLIVGLAPLLSALEAQAVDRPRACLVHNPAEHRAILGVVMRCPAPDVMKDIDGELFSGFPISYDSHDQRKHEAMSSFI